MSEQSTVAVRSRHPAVRWTLADMLLVVALSAATTVVLAAAIGLGLRLGGGDPRTSMRAHVVAFSAAAGIAIYGMILLIVYLVVVQRRHLTWAAVGFRKPPLRALILSPFVVLGQLVAAAIMNVLVLSVTGGFENPQITSITGGQGFSWISFGLMLAVAGVAAPVVEETLFRGLLFGWLRSRLPLFAAVTLSAAIFAAAHVIPVLLPALFAVGVILAIAYELSGSLWVSILLHAMQNTFAVVLIFVMLALGIPLQR